MGAGTDEAEENFFAFDADEFEVAAVGLEHGAEFVELGEDLFLHGWFSGLAEKGGNDSRF